MLPPLDADQLRCLLAHHAETARLAELVKFVSTTDLFKVQETGTYPKYPGHEGIQEAMREAYVASCYAIYRIARSTCVR